MNLPSWIENFPGQITVCGPDGAILEMNELSAVNHQAEGGRNLIGSDVTACHPEPARSKVKQMLETQQANVYTIEKNGVKKLVYQTPWYDAGEYGGFIEIVLEIPFEMPHFIRG